MSSESNSGLTIIEVVIAISILVVGVLAAVGFQASTLSVNRDSQIMNQLTRWAATEMEYRRQTLVESSGDGFPCVTAGPGGLREASCTVDIHSCGISISENSSEFVCDENQPFATYRLRVRASTAEHEIELNSLYGGYYVSGSLSTE